MKTKFIVILIMVFFLVCINVYNYLNVDNSFRYDGINYDFSDIDLDEINNNKSNDEGITEDSNISNNESSKKDNNNINGESSNNNESNNNVNNSQELTNENETKSTTKQIKLNYGGETNLIDLEEYVIGVVACEMPASFESEALKSLAVAARTYAMYKLYKNKDYILKSTISDQCYISNNEMRSKWSSSFDKYYTKIKNAVYDTQNEIIMYKNEPILAMYFSISNGSTENVESVFNEKLDYLVSVDSTYDEKYNYKENTIVMRRDEFLSKLGIDEIYNLNIVRNSTNRVDSITINDKVYSGVEFRTLFSLKSTDFVLDISDDVSITTKGYGHGVGLSEYGANAMALLGNSYKDIINHYYTNVNIVNNY